MPSNDSQGPNANDVSGTASHVTTGGAMARARRRRLVLLGGLAAALAVLSYASYYYAQNRRLPLPQVVTSSSQVVEAPAFQTAFSGTDANAMTQPTGIGVIRDRVYVTDSAWHSVRAYTRDGGYLFTFGPIADGKNTRLSSPVHLAVAGDDTIWVTDRGLRGVYVFDENGKFLRKFAPNGDAAFSWSPLAIAFGPDGNLYVSDVGNSQKHRILAFAADGRLLSEWGRTAQVSSVGESPGAFLFPNGIAVKGTGANALVFVADGNNRRVQVFHPDGSFVRLINTSGTPRGIALDSQGRLYVVDALSHRVDIYSEVGVPLATFGENGVSPGQFSFPNDVVIDSTDRILVTDRDNNQVQVWGYGVAEIPGVTRITPGNWWLSLIALPFLTLPFVFRRRRFVVAPDFVEGMVVADLVGKMTQGRWRWVMTEADAAPYAGRVVEGVDLGEILHGEPYSDTEAGQLKGRFSVALQRAGLLAMAMRYRILCTEDVELAGLAAALGIDVYDRASWLEKFAQKR
jgi:DNA-binding beta-propeller fold protein YncE